MRIYNPLSLVFMTAIAGCTQSPLTASNVNQPATVIVSCMIETSGLADHCNLVSNTGGPAYAASTMAWLTGPNPPRYRPDEKNGQAVAQRHAWKITYRPNPN